MYGRCSKRSSKDEFGKPLQTKTAAVKARRTAIENEKNKPSALPIEKKTLEEVFEEYREKGRKDRKYQTIRKQDSLWKNHLSKKFGKRFVDDIASL